MTSTCIYIYIYIYIYFFFFFVGQIVGQIDHHNTMKIELLYFLIFYILRLWQATIEDFTKDSVFK